jgi:DNA-directed RNA polymerase specialized sigma24 family protein
LQRAAQGDQDALNSAYSSLYPDLKRVARAMLYRRGKVGTMQTTVLVHESFLRLLGNKELQL